MLNALKKLWTALFVACLHFPFAAVVSGLIGPRNGLTFWIMAMAAHWPMRSVTNLSLGRRLTIWLTAMAVGITAFVGLATMLGMITINLLTLVSSGHVPLTFVFWLGFAIGLAPVMVAWVVSGILVRRSSRQRQAASPPAATRQST